MEISPVANDNTAVPPFGNRPAPRAESSALIVRTVECNTALTNRLVQKVIEADKWLKGLEAASGFNRITEEDYLRLRMGLGGITAAFDSYIAELKRTPAVRDQVGRYPGRQRPARKGNSPKQAPQKGAVKQAQQKPARPAATQKASSPDAGPKQAPAAALAAAAPAATLPPRPVTAASLITELEPVRPAEVKALDTSGL